MTNNIFNIKGFRKSQKAISNEYARNLIKHLTKNSDLGIYGKNGKIRGWIIGTMIQHSKKNPWGQNNIKSTFGYQK